MWYKYIYTNLKWVGDRGEIELWEVGWIFEGFGFGVHSAGWHAEG